jgi:hypothetical protein
LNRQIDGIAPTFEKKPAIKQENDGRVLFFECIIQADPEPAVSWYHNGSLIQQRGRFKVRKSSLKSFSTFKNFSTY